jgi:putative PEP-CTERM system histidine kinase
MPATDAVPGTHPLVTAMRGGGWIARLDGPHQAALAAAPLHMVGPLWLAVPLLHRGDMIGFVLSGAPRAPFDLEQEVFDLLRIVAQEVATYIAEQRATQTLLQTRQLHDYSQRFAFVAHDIKNVSSQLALLLSNAERHIANPEFQKDMLETVRSSVRKITTLLQRLERPEPDMAPGIIAPLPRLEALISTYQRVRRSRIVLEHDGSTGAVAMGAEAFEAAVTHLLNNAVEASTAVDGRLAGPVFVKVRHEARQVVVEIVDQGPGMSPEFVRDELFWPFSTTKPAGSGIGAYQAREMTRTAGGELTAISEPGSGTTMQMTLPRTDTRSVQNPLQRESAASGTVGV